MPPSCVGDDVADCASPSVPGATYARSGQPDAGATVSTFRLDAHEVTLERFSEFVTAVVLGSGVPAAGAGKHAHLNQGAGLATVLPDGGAGFETGWDPAWNGQLATTLDAWTTALTCVAPYTWMPTLSPDQSLPIDCVTWYEAYAFCIWDGGFLPSEAEWNAAAAGGTEQRTFPWGAQPPGDDASLAVYGCYYDFAATGGVCNELSIAPVASVRAGDGRFGQSESRGQRERVGARLVRPVSVPLRRLRWRRCRRFARPPGGRLRSRRDGYYHRLARLRRPSIP